MRTYELVLVVDPRLSDEEVVTLTEDYKKMITGGGAQVVKEESWGRRKLAFPIAKLNEAKYVYLVVQTNGKNPLPEVEHRLRQNDRVLRFLTVRIDVMRPTPMQMPAAAPEAGRREGAPAAPAGEEA